MEGYINDGVVTTTPAPTASMTQLVRALPQAYAYAMAAAVSAPVVEEGTGGTSAVNTTRGTPAVNDMETTSTTGVAMGIHHTHFLLLLGAIFVPSFT